MPRSGPRAVRKYSDEFKLTAVRLTQQPGLQVKTVAAALTIHRTPAITCTVLVQAARHRAARGVIFHSDRGSEYIGAPFCARWRSSASCVASVCAGSHWRTPTGAEALSLG